MFAKLGILGRWNTSAGQGGTIFSGWVRISKEFWGLLSYLKVKTVCKHIPPHCKLHLRIILDCDVLLSTIEILRFLRFHLCSPLVEVRNSENGEVDDHT